MHTIQKYQHIDHKIIWNADYSLRLDVCFKYQFFILMLLSFLMLGNRQPSYTSILEEISEYHPRIRKSC